VIDTPSIFKLIRKTAVLVRVLSTFPFRFSENFLLFIMNRESESYRKDARMRIGAMKD